MPSGLNNLKRNVDKSNIGKLETTPFNLKTSSDVLEKAVVKKAVYDEVAKKDNAIDTNELVKKHCNAKIHVIRGEIPSIAGLAPTAALNAVKNKIPSINGLVKKTNYDAKIKYIEGKYFTTSDYNKFTNDILDAKIKQKELVN